MFKKLRNRMLLFNMISISFIIIIAFSAVYFATYSNIERENNRQLRGMASMPFAPELPIFDTNNGRPPLTERLGPDYRVSFSLFTEDGNLVGVSSHLNFEEEVYIKALEKTDGRQSGKIKMDERKWAFMVSEGPLHDQNRYERMVFLDITNGAKTLRTLLITLTLVGLMVLLVLLWFSYRFAARAVSPIEESYNKQKQFVTDASHEFKTPISIIEANLDAIQTSGKESVDSQKEWFDYIRAELKRTTKLVDNLLYLAKADTIDSRGNIPFNLSYACETACASMEAVLYDSGISLKTDIKENVIVLADSENIQQVIYILLDNAGKYTPDYGQISVSLKVEYEEAVLGVTNTGKGILAEDLPRIFNRFYRPDSSRSKETGGFGLGLSIAKTIVERSGGEISLESGNDITTFIVKLRLF